MEAKAIQATRTKLNVLADSHNKLTTLVAVLLTEIQTIKQDMENIKEMLDGVEVVSNDTNEETKPKASHQQQFQQQSQRIQPQQQKMMSMPPPPQQSIQQAKSSSNRSRGGSRNSSLAELHADDIIKQLTMNSD